MVFEGAAAVGLVELPAESFVLQHDIEDVAQHFECDNIGFRDHRGGARIKIHAGHLAEEIAGAEFGDRIAISEIDGGVYGNGSVSHLLLALVLFTRDESAGQPFEETFCPALGFDVSDGSGDGDFGLSFENVESGGTKFPFTADDFAFAEAALDDGAAIELEECTGHAFENGNLQELLGFEALGAWTDSDCGA